MGLRVEIVDDPRTTLNLTIGKTEEIPEGHGSCLCASSRRLSEATWLALDIKILRALNFVISARSGQPFFVIGQAD